MAKVAHLRGPVRLQVTPGGLAHVHRYAELCEQVRNAPVVTPGDRWRIGGERHCHHPGDDGLRDLSRPRVRRWLLGTDYAGVNVEEPKDGVSSLRRTAPKLSQSPTPTLQAASGGLTVEDPLQQS